MDSPKKWFDNVDEQVADLSQETARTPEDIQMMLTLVRLNRRRRILKETEDGINELVEGAVE